MRILATSLCSENGTEHGLFVVTVLSISQVGCQMKALSGYTILYSAVFKLTEKMMYLIFFKKLCYICGKLGHCYDAE